MNLVQFVPLMCLCALLNKLTVFGHLPLTVSTVVTVVSAPRGCRKLCNSQKIWHQMEKEMVIWRQKKHLTRTHPYVTLTFPTLGVEPWNWKTVVKGGDRWTQFIKGGLDLLSSVSWSRMHLPIILFLQCEMKTASIFSIIQYCACWWCIYTVASIY